MPCEPMATRLSRHTMPRPRRDALPGKALCNTESGRDERAFTTIQAFSPAQVSHGSIPTNYRGAKTIPQGKRRRLRHARAKISLERSERGCFRLCRRRKGSDFCNNLTSRGPRPAPHSREGGNPFGLSKSTWIPAFAGMTGGETRERAHDPRGAHGLTCAHCFHARPRRAFNWSRTCFSEFEQAA